MGPFNEEAHAFGGEFRTRRFTIRYSAGGLIKVHSRVEDFIRRKPRSADSQMRALKTPRTRDSWCRLLAEENCFEPWAEMCIKRERLVGAVVGSYVGLVLR